MPWPNWAVKRTPTLAMASDGTPHTFGAPAPLTWGVSPFMEVDPVTEKKERANTFDTGVAAEYFVLSQIYRLGLEAYISQGNKKAIDIRVIQENGNPISVDVKAVRGYSSLVVNNVKTSESHYIAFVIYNNKFEDVLTQPEVFIVPSLEVPSITQHFKKEKRVMKGSLEKYLNNWTVIKSKKSLQSTPEIGAAEL